MLLAVVRSAIFGGRFISRLKGYRLLEVEVLCRDGQQLVPSGEKLVVVDGLFAGPGDVVLVATGTRVRELVLPAELPAKSVVLGIVSGCSLPFRIEGNG